MQKRNNRQGKGGREIKYLKKDEWLRLIALVDNYRDKLVLNLLYHTGMRVGELSLLEVEEIDFEERYIHIPAENTKTKTSRTVVVNREVLSDLIAYQKMVKVKKGKLFDITVRRIQQLLSEYSKKAGVDATPHTLRHSHIVHALMNHIPMSAVQKQVGHKNLTTTQIYSDLAPEQVREAYEKQEVEK